MARIKNTVRYPYDIVPEAPSYLVGTDTGDLKKTKSYRLDTIFSLLDDGRYIGEAPLDGNPYVRQSGVWQLMPTTGAGDVFSVFGRIGAVTAQVGDYAAFYSQLGHTHAYSSLTGIPTEFTPEAHTHVTSEITDLAAYTGFDARYYTESEADAAFAPISHTHTESDIIDLQNYLLSVGIGDLNTTGTPTPTTYLDGNFSWSAPVGAISSVFGRTGAITALVGDYSSFYAPISHTHTESDITDLQAYLLSVDISDINANGTPNSTNFLRGDGEWATGVTSLTTLSDVTITTATLGDLLAYNGTFWQNFGVGTDGQVLTADSGEVTGLIWADAPTTVNISGTPTTGQAAEWTNANTLQGVNTTGTGNYVKSVSPTFTGTPVFPSDFTIGANSFTRSGAHNLTLTTTGATNITFPTSGTLANLAGAQTLTNKTIAFGSNTLTNVMSLNTNQSVTGQKTFSALGFNAASSDNANDFETFMPIQDSIFVDSNSTLSTNYPGEFGQFLIVRGATSSRSFAFWKANGNNSAHYIGNYNDSLVDWEWYRNVHEGMTDPIFSSTGDVTLTLAADTDNVGENDNPLFLMTQDGGGVQAHYGINGDADAKFTGAIANYAYHHSPVGSGGWQWTVGNSLKMTMTGTALFLENGQDFIISGGGDINFTSTGSVLQHTNEERRDKLWVWNNSQYSIGMQSGYTFGGINNDFAMTFQFSNTSTRGFWWGDSAHTNAQGAMALTTQGRLTVASYTRIGYGESDTTIPGTTYMLQVNGNVQASNFTLSSDRRLKKNVRDLIPTSVPVRWRKFDWIDGNKGQIGVIAQELRETNPEFVIEDEQGMLSVKYTDLLVAKVAELEGKVDRLELILESLL